MLTPALVNIIISHKITQEQCGKNVFVARQKTLSLGNKYSVKCQQQLYFHQTLVG